MSIFSHVHARINGISSLFRRQQIKTCGDGADFKIVCYLNIVWMVKQSMAFGLMKIIPLSKYMLQVLVEDFSNISWSVSCKCLSMHDERISSIVYIM